MEQPRTNNLQKITKSRIAPAVWCGSDIPTLLICSAPCLRKCDLLHFSGLRSSPLAAPVASVPSWNIPAVAS
ncbi:hypothetical protein ECSTECEH250_1462 [Escherichia coli STEC_EH250]|nr:hypothetical protein ECSTECEH250_1462 [Escherichia coli STEC_EH250]